MLDAPTDYGIKIALLVLVPSQVDSDGDLLSCSKVLKEIGPLFQEFDFNRLTVLSVCYVEDKLSFVEPRWECFHWVDGDDPTS